MDEMKTLTINDVTYEIVDEVARSNANVFVAIYGVTTSAELDAAYNDNKLVLCVYDNGVYTMTGRFSATKHSFDSPFGHTIWTIIVENDVWGDEYESNMAFADHTHRFDDNITGGSANDTVAFWVEKGPGYCWISELDQVINQPVQHGFIISYANETDVFQIFRDQHEPYTYYRSGDNINGWFQHWTRVITVPEEFNLTTMGMAAVPLDSSAVTLTTDTTAIRNALANGSVKLTFQFIYSGTTMTANAIAYPFYLVESDEYQVVFNTAVRGVPMCACFSISTTAIVARCIPLTMAVS